MNMNLTRFESDGIELYINTVTGESFATAKGYSRMTGVEYDTIKRRCQRGDILNTQIPTAQGLKTGLLIPIATVLAWQAKDCPALVCKTKEIAEETTGVKQDIPKFPLFKKKIKNDPEKQIQIFLNHSVLGKMEVPCKTGRIDILTKSEIIEIKKAIEWKYAIGQVLVYQLEYPDRQARIHLYGECSEEFKQMVISFALRLNVIATFEG